jgi:two-component system cell cycle sensor histidine kinase/response regulator CckA
MTSEQVRPDRELAAGTPAPDDGAAAGTGSPPRSVADELLMERRRPGDIFRTIFNSVTDGILIFTPTGRILEVNRVVCERLGYSRDELIGMTIADIDTAATAALFAARMRLVVDRGFATFEVEHIRKDGTTIPLEVGSRAIEFEGELAILSVQRDITERRRIQSEADEQRVYIEALLDAIPTPIVAKDTEGRIQQCNSAFLNHWNLTRDQVKGKSIQELGLPYGQQYRALDEQVVESGEVLQHEAWLPVASGPKRMIMTRAPLRQADGQIRGSITTAFDITERYLAEQALRQSEERARTLFEGAGDSVFIADLTGRLIDVNPTAAQVLGYTREEMLGMGIADVSAQADPELLRNLIDTVLERGHLAFETTHARRDGTLLPVEVSVTCVELEDRTVLLGIARDISERKRAEAERTLLESQLRQAQKMEGIGRLASGIAHDFNNLLTAIGGFAGLAISGLSENDERRRDIEQIQESTHRAARLVRQLLEFSRVNRVEAKVISPAEVLARLERMLQPIVGEEIAVGVDTRDCTRNVLADAGQIEQVIVNLVVNACDAMRNGGRLEIRAADVDVDQELALAIGGTPGPNVLIEVTDTGTGMDSETMEHLFEPFFTTKGPGEGTGLGLATVYGIVRNWNGGLRVRSELGRGSTFEVYLPCVDQAPARPETIRDAPVAGKAGRGRKILVVEDDEIVRQLTVRILTGAGYEVVAPTTAPAAVELGRRDRPDLLLTDVIMPTLRGAEVAAELRAAHPDLPVLYMSGYTDRSPDDSGSDQYLAKPFLAEDLLRAVERAMLGELVAD